MIKHYTKYIIPNARMLLVTMISFFAFVAAGQSFTITSVSTPDNTFYYPYEEIDVTYASDYSWPTGTTFYLVLDVNGDGEYSEGDHLLDSDNSSSGTLSGILPNDPATYNLLVVAGNDGDPGSDSELSDTQVNSFTLTRSGTDELVYPLNFDLLNTDRSITSALDDYDDGYEYTIFVSLDADSVTSSNPVTLEYIVGDDTTAMSDVEGNSEFTASTDTLVFELPAGALMADVRFRLSQQGGDTLAADTLEWAISDLRIQSNDDSFIRYGVVDNGGFTTTSPTIVLGDDTLSVYVGEDIGIAYEGLGYTTGSTFYLYSGDITDPEDRIIYGSSTGLEDSLTGTWPYADEDIDLFIAGYYGNIDTPELDFDADTLTVLGSDQSTYNMQFDLSGVRNASTPSLDISGEEYGTLELTLSSNGASFTDANALVVAYNTGSGWVSIDSLTGNFNTNYEFEITNDMVSSSTTFRVRQANTANAAGSNDWALGNFDVKLHELQNSVAVSNPGNYPNFYSINVQTVYEVTDEDDTVAITEAYPGDQILVYATVNGFDLDADSVNFAVVIDGSYLLESTTINSDTDADSLLISGTIPADIVYDTDRDVQVKLYSGSSAVIGLNVNVFNDYDAEEDDSEISFMGGEYDSGSKSVTFEDAGDRWLTTPAINIPTSDGLTIDFTLKRENSVRSPDGTGVVFEYSTDGSTYTEIDTYSINAAGSSGTTYTLEDGELSGVEGSSVLFRFRQASNNGVDLDKWTLSNIVFTNGTTIVNYEYLEYNSTDLDILEPVITLEAFDDSEEYYPGEDLEVVFSTDGIFPSGTEYELLVDNGIQLVFGEFTTSGTHTVTVPALVEGVYSNIKIVADNDEQTESNTVNLTINGVEITNLNVTSSESTTDGDYEFIYPGNEITVSYNTVGEIGDGVLAYLEVYDGIEEEYVILEDSITVGDAITTTLPIGLDYTENGPEDGDPGPDFRLSLKDMSGVVSFTTDDNTWNNTTLISGERFPLDDREGHQASNYFYNNSSTRSAQSIPYNFKNGGTVDFDLRLLGTGFYNQDQPIYLQYSTDGETWEELEEGTIENTTADIFPDEIEIPEEAWMDSVYVRFIYNEDELVSGSSNLIYFYGFEVNYYMSDPIAEEEFDLEDVSDLNLEYLSIALATLEETEFRLGEEFNLEYNVDGPFGDDVDFAVVLNETVSGEYRVLAESDETGAVDATVNAPSLEFGDDSPNYELVVYPFIKTSEDDTYRAATVTEELDSEDDFIAISGRDTNESGFSGAITFEEKGERFLTTRALDLEDFGDITLNFDFTFSGLEGSTLVLPVLEVSTDDGATFEAIPVTDATYEEEGLVYPGGNYSVEVDEMYHTSATHFRWRQPVNGGNDAHIWTLNNISVDKGETNVFNPAAYNTIGMNQAITLIGPDFDDFVWAQADSSDAVFNGEDFEYSFTVDSSKIDETTFPDGTQFIFTLEDVRDPDTDEDYVLATTSAYGTGTASIPFYVENGTYNVYAVAEYTVENEETGEEETIILDEQVVASLDIFLRVVKTTLEFDESDVLYAGNSATFSIDVENDETVTGGLDDLFANLLVIDFDGSDDLLLATQTGTDDITVDLPPHLRGDDYEFQIRLTEGTALGEAGDIADFDGMGDSESLTPEDFLNGEFVTMVETNDFYEYNFGSYDVNRLITWDYDFDPVLAESEVANERLALHYSTDGGNTWSYYTNWSGPNTGSYSVNLNNFINGGGYNDPAGTGWERVRFRWSAVDPWGDGYSNPQERGSRIELTNIEIAGQFTSLEDNSTYFPDGGSTYGPVFENDFGRGLMTTRDFETGELGNYALISFDLSFDEELTNMAANQVLILEYSTDGGSSYTEIASLPNQDVYDDLYDGEEMAIDDESFEFPVTDDMKSSTTRFRFRQEERNNIDVVIANVSFLPIKTLPFDYVSDERYVANQVLLVTSIGASEVCFNTEATIDYELRGKLGDMNLVTIEAEGESLGSFDIDDEFTISDATGTLTFSIPTGTLSMSDNNDFVKFRLLYEDETNEDYTISETSGDLSEQYVELVAPINLSASFSVAVGAGSDIRECDPEEVIVSINSPQNYFMYEIYNVETDEVLGTLTYDPEEDNEIELGSFTEEVILDMRITSMSSEGTLTCNTRETNTNPVTVEYLETFKLFVHDGTSWEIVEADMNDSLIVCAGSSSGLTFDVYRDEDNTVNPDMIEWFRDDLNTSVSSNATISGILEAGDYFARVTDGNCTYTTESFRIVEAEVPDAPEITVVSGDLTTCDGSVEVELSAPDGFAYYLWSNGETTQTITVEDDGTFDVQVGNTFTCLSEESEEVEIETIDKVEFRLYNTDIQTVVTDGQSFTACEEVDFRTWDIENDGSFETAGSGDYVVYQDGMEYATFTGSSFSIDEDGEYYVEWVSDILNPNSCTSTSPTFTVDIVDAIEELPVITINGSLTLCEGDTVNLSAPDGFTYYLWSNGETTQEITVDEADTYTVQVGNTFSCLSEESEEVEVEVLDKVEFRLYNADIQTVVNDGQSFTACEEVDFRTWDIENDGSFESAGSGDYVVYQDGVEYATFTGSSFSIDEDGEYYVEWVSDILNPNSCTSTSPTFTVDIVDAIEEQPVITVSGSLTLCDGDEVTLSAPAGFAHYLWSNGETTQEITVDEADTYTVQVGNNFSCLSEESEEVDVEVSEIVDFLLYNFDTENTVIEGQNFIGCEKTTFQTREFADYTDYQDDGSGTFILYKDGVQLEQTNGVSISIGEDGEYFVEWVSDVLNPDACTTMSPTFTVDILDEVDVMPVITADGPLAFCEGGTVTLSATTGFTHYQWMRNGTVLQNNSETLEVTKAGDYTVEVANAPFSANYNFCASETSAVVKVRVFAELDLDLEVDGNGVDNMEVVDVCGEDEAVLEVDGLPGGSYQVTWYLDGTAITGLSARASSIEVMQSGVYYAEVTQSVGNINDNTSICVTATNPVVLNYYEIPDAVSITDPGAGTFCEGEVDVTLTADAGAAFYQWYLDGDEIGEPISSNELHVTVEGDYTVEVLAHEDGCASELSNVITIEEVPLPSTSGLTVSSEADCGAGVVVTFTGTSPEFAYQLINFNTDELIGNPVTGASASVEVSYPDIAESTPVYVQVSYADGTGGCTAETSGSVALTPNNLMLELEGATLRVVTSGTVLTIAGTNQIRWFRNDVEMVNKEGVTSITVIDAATYRVEADYAGGCTITSNAIDLSAGGRVSPTTAGENIVANTYPNPTVDVVNLDIPGDVLGTVKVQIMTLSGQIVISESFEKNAEQFVKEFDVSRLNAGIYNLTVTQGNKVENIRIVKK